MWAGVAEHLDQIGRKVSREVRGNDVREAVQTDGNFLRSGAEVLYPIIGTLNREYGR